ncbi:hypothetical protein [Pseudonocardia phyllosphaerae]|uniref:hypothetical protein n=1 Tax=Pseudonocardia phyllosphaerae TaxID=3390502 RepID=UPI00397CB87F
MLKKAGIVAAAGAASLVAVSPLAFAGEGNDQTASHHGHGKDQTADNASGNVAQNNSHGLVNVADNNVQVSPQLLCGNQIAGNDVVKGALGLLKGKAKNESDNNSSNTASCTNAPSTGETFNQ